LLVGMLRFCSRVPLSYVSHELFCVCNFRRTATDQQGGARRCDELYPGRAGFDCLWIELGLV
jgi:hypothetical protein